MVRKKLPVGIEFFESFFRDDFYYIDKTGLIIELLNKWGNVNLFTRPRRFGKSLNMSMLKAFFEIGNDRTLFEGLAISKEKDLCDSYMGKFPVISITLKGIDRHSFENAVYAMKYVIGTEALRFEFLKESDRLNDEDKSAYRSLIRMEDGSFSMSYEQMLSSLQKLSYLLEKHYGKKTIILIDEYDVPLDKAFQAGFYEEMVSMIRNLFGNALKTNDSLQFAVLTGCLRISRESIFTGLNNLKVHTITDNRYAEYFGFTDKEVRKLLDDYGLSDHYEIVKEWYDGYRFGSVNVYCPWDVINYCDAALADKQIVPENYWANSSGNALVRRFIDKADQQTRNDIEKLIAGEMIAKTVNMELTYNELDSSIENLWSVLFTTGYLTQRGRVDEDNRRYWLAIPNKEIRELFITQIKKWFFETTRKDTSRIEKFCAAFPAADIELIEEMLNDYLWETISIRDTSVKKSMKENFYHGMLLGLLRHDDSWLIRSNAESGEGYSDILIETPKRIGVVIEVKYADDGNLDKACEDAVAQIESKHYDAQLIDDGMKTIVKMGIAFYKKRCKVILGA